MNDEFFDRLKANDPASAAEPDLTRIKARVDAHTADNVVPMPRRSEWSRGLRVAAAVGALALAGGAGFAGGNLSHSSSNSPESLIGAVAPGTSDTSRLGVGIGGGGVGGDAAANDKMVAGGFGGYWGNVILKPGSAVSNADGTAYSYVFTSDGLDRKALANAVAESIGLKAIDIKLIDGAYQANDDKGAYNIYVGSDAQVWFNGYNNAVSPWACEQELAGGGNGKDVNITQEMSTKCDQLWKSPSKADAIAAAKTVFASLGLDGLKNAKYQAFDYNTRAITVNITPVIDGMEVASAWSAEVSKDGVFSISGAGARIVKADAYPTVGARDAALRSELRKWSSFGPMNVYQPQVDYTSNNGSSATPTTPTKNGKPMVQAYVSDVAVLGASRGLMQVYLAGGEVMLMPAWNFTAQDGSIWQMIALTDDYVDWTQAANGGPIAYDTLGTGATARSGSASVAAPAME